MDERTSRILSSYLEETSIALFRDVGVDFELADGVGGFEPDITSVIGFAGNLLAGALALCSSAASLRELSVRAGTTYQEDWLGELANQLLGRIKRRLSAHGAGFRLSTPVVITGERLRVIQASLNRRPPLALGLTSAAGQMEVWLEVELAERFELPDRPQDDGSLAEGEALLF